MLASLCSLAYAGFVISTLVSKKGVFSSSVKPSFSTYSFASAYAWSASLGGLAWPAAADNSTPVYSG
jgi:hypothetical protein